MKCINCILVVYCLFTILSTAESNCTCKQVYLGVPDGRDDYLDKFMELCNDTVCEDTEDDTLCNNTTQG